MTYSFISTIIPLLGVNNHDIVDFSDHYIQALESLGVRWELIFVLEETDGNKILESLPAANERVRVLFASTRDWGSAVQTGLKKAGGDLLSYSNWLSTSPENLRLILSTALANPGMVIKATRRVDGYWLRRLGGALYTLECQCLFDLPYWDINATPRAFPRSFERLMNLKSNGFLMETEFCVVCQRAQYQVLEVPIHVHRKYPRLSISGWAVDAKLFWGALKLYREFAQVV
jgi:hypothetical protein